MWATKDEATEYLKTSVGGASWDALSADNQDRYLGTAFKTLSADPNYAFPDVATENMKEAQIEFAFSMLRNPDGQQAAALAAAGVESFNVGNFSMGFMSDADIAKRTPYPPIVTGLIDEFESLQPAAGLLTRK